MHYRETENVGYFLIKKKKLNILIDSKFCKEVAKINHGFHHIVTLKRSISSKSHGNREFHQMITSNNKLVNFVEQSHIKIVNFF